MHIAFQWHNADRDGKYCLDSGNRGAKVGVKANMNICDGLGANQVRKCCYQDFPRSNKP